MTAPLIHIGFHKTASTLLQRNLFLQEELGFHLPTKGRVGIHRAFITRFGLDPLPTDAVSEMQAEQKTASSKGGALVLSHERLSGYPASGGFDQGLIAERLKEAFPDGKIVMLIREQRQMIYSMYLQTITDGGTLSLARFLKRPEPILLRKPAFDLGYYEYDRVIAKYQSLFGPENVCVIAFEQFKRDTDTHARALVDFALGPEAASRYVDGCLDAPVNKARPLAFQALRRQLNRLIRNQLNENGLLPIPNEYIEYGFRKIMPVFEVLRPFDRVIKQRLKAHIAKACDGRYAESNRRLQDLTGLDLAALGYDT
ncbi:MAG: sulfotransferase [Aliishimia sp.]